MEQEVNKGERRYKVISGAICLPACLTSRLANRPNELPLLLAFALAYGAYDLPPGPKSCKMFRSIKKIFVRVRVGGSSEVVASGSVCMRLRARACVWRCFRYWWVM